MTFSLQDTVASASSRVKVRDPRQAEDEDNIVQGKLSKQILTQAR